VQESHAGGAQAVLPELDPGFPPRKVMEPSRHGMPADVRNRKSLVGKEQWLLALAVVRVVAERTIPGPSIGTSRTPCVPRLVTRSSSRMT